MAKHPGFQAVQSSIAKKQGISSERAGAILAASSRGASKSAKKANPRLKRVHGGSTLLSANSQKAIDMREGRSSNLADKCCFRGDNCWNH